MVTLGLGTVLLFGGGGSGPDQASVQIVAAGAGSEQADAGTAAQDRNARDEPGSEGGRSGAGREATDESQANAAAIPEPDAAPPAPEDVPAAPATGTEEEVPGDGDSKPNRNPDHSGPGGEPEVPSTPAVSEPDTPNTIDQPNVNPDHYGPGGEPEVPSTPAVSEPDTPNTIDQPNVNPDE